jgi:hypothetical protein
MDEEVSVRDLSIVIRYSNEVSDGRLANCLPYAVSR